MSISFLLKRGLTKPKHILQTGFRHKNFIYAPPPPKLAPLHKSYSNATKISMSQSWLNIQKRNLHTHRPTSKAELLAQARGFFERLKIRIKYPLMRQIRPWTLNDATALFSWLFLGHTVWLLAGTTSFVSIILWLANSLQFQGK